MKTSAPACIRRWENLLLMLQNDNTSGMFSHLWGSQCFLELIRVAQCPQCQGVKEGVARVCGCVGVCPTLPGTAVQLYPHADCGRQFGDRKQPDVTRDDGRVKVVDDWSIRVFVALYHLQINSSWHFSWRENWFNSPNIKLFLWIIPLRKIQI